MLLEDKIRWIRRSHLLALFNIDIGQDDFGTLFPKALGDGGSETRATSYMMSSLLDLNISFILLRGV